MSTMRHESLRLLVWSAWNRITRWVCLVRLDGAATKHSFYQRLWWRLRADGRFNGFREIKLVPGSSWNQPWRLM